MPLILPFLKEGYFPTHDGEWAVVRQGTMHRAFISHHFPARWAGNQNYGFGYPLFLFTYPLPYYIGEFFKIAGFGLVGSVKALFVLSVFISGVGMFLLGKELFGYKGGLISSILYLYVPYRMVNLYVRGSLGESLSSALFPILFLLIIKISKDHNPKLIGIFSILLGALLLTHNISALIFSPFLIALSIVIYIRNKKKFPVRNLIAGFILGIMISAFFLFPAVLEKHNIVLSQIKLADLSKNFITFDQLIRPNWGFGAYGEKDSFSPQLGIVHLLSLVIGVILLFVYKKNLRKNYLALFSLISFAILIFLSFPVSLFFWKNTPFFADIDFPWRVLGPATFFLCLFIGFISTNRITSFLAIGLVVLAIFINTQYAYPKSFSNLADSYYFTNDATTTSADELMPIWVKEKPTKRVNEKVKILSGTGDISNMQFNSVQALFNSVSAKPIKVQLQVIYFPGWQVKIDDKIIQPNFNNKKGLIEFMIPQGNHIINANFIETKFRLLTDIISLIGLIIVCIIMFKPRILLNEK